MSAVRLARAATSGTREDRQFGGVLPRSCRPVSRAGRSGALTLGVPTSPGVTRAAAGDTLLASYNDLDSVRRAFDANRGRSRPSSSSRSPGTWGWLPPADGFLRGLRDVCSVHGALLIFDEIISGFRAAAGGAQALADVRPDLTCLGKIIGGGLPVGAYGGRADLMESGVTCRARLSGWYPVGNPLAMTAGIWSLDRLTPRLYRNLAALGTRLAAGLADAARGAGVPLQVNAFGSMLTPFFTDRPVRDYQSAISAETDRYAPILSRDDLARCLSAAVAIRGVVPVGRTYRERCRQDDCGGRERCGRWKGRNCEKPAKVRDCKSQDGLAGDFEVET